MKISIFFGFLLLIIAQFSFAEQCYCVQPYYLIKNTEQSLASVQAAYQHSAEMTNKEECKKLGRCRRFELTFNKNMMCVFEVWKDKQSHQAHLQEPWFLKARDAREDNVVVSGVNTGACACDTQKALVCDTTRFTE